MGAAAEKSSAAAATLGFARNFCVLWSAAAEKLLTAALALGTTQRVLALQWRKVPPLHGVSNLCYKTKREGGV